MITNLPVKKYVFIGSYALGTRPCKDIDIICLKEDIEIETRKGKGNIESFYHQGCRIECHICDELPFFRSLYEKYDCANVASYDDLLSIKAGHLHIPSHKWEMHMMDYQVLRRLANHLNPGDVAKHRRDMDKIHKTFRPKLKGVSKEDFFDDGVIKHFDHDYLHEQVALGDCPSYKLMQKDETVECHYDLWSKMTYEEKLNCVIEESTVITLERFVIPMTKRGEFIGDMKALYRKGVQKVCTTLSSGWFQNFCWEKYVHVINAYPKAEQKIEEFIKKP